MELEIITTFEIYTNTKIIMKKVFITLSVIALLTACGAEEKKETEKKAEKEVEVEVVDTASTEELIELTDGTGRKFPLDSVEVMQYEEVDEEGNLIYNEDGTIKVVKEVTLLSEKNKKTNMVEATDDEGNTLYDENGNVKMVEAPK